MSPSADRPIRRSSPRRSRWVSIGLTVLAVAGLGGAVAAAYVTSVELGAGLAPIDDPDAPASDDVAAGGPGSTDAPTTVGSTATTSAAGGPDTTTGLPDRVRPPGTNGPSTTTDPTVPPTGGDEVPAPVGPFPGAWPYGSWAEVDAHRSRGDSRFLTPTDTALRLVREVIGSASPTVTDIAIDGDRATVTVRNQGASTRVRMVRTVADGALAGAPWSVTGATGQVDLAATDTVAGATITARTSTAGVVAVFDRVRWRGVGVTATGGSVEVRVEPGSAGRGLVVALGGDPRDPSSFSLRPVDLRAGAGAAPPAPTGVQTATDALLGALRTGDVGGAWAVLSRAARTEALDWRGLAARMPALAERWSALSEDGRRTVTVATTVGEAAVVLPGTAPGDGLALLLDGGTARVASLEPASTEMVIEPDAAVVRGSARPAALLVDGTPVEVTADGPAGARLPLASVAPGAHVVTAVVVEAGAVRVAHHSIVVTAVEPPPSTTGPSAPTG